VANSTDLLRHFLQIQNNKEIITRTLVAEPKPIPIAKEEYEMVNDENVTAHEEQINPLEEHVYPSGEPHTATALELAEQLQSQSVVPIRDQHEQIMQHVLG
jgi:hypothetical protein